MNDGKVKVRVINERKKKIWKRMEAKPTCQTDGVEWTKRNVRGE